MKARFFKAVKVQKLLAEVSENLGSYRAGNFDFLVNDPANYFETNLEINVDKLSLVSG